MSIENVRQHLKKFKLEKRIVEHEEVGDTVEHAAQVLGCDEKQIAKSLTFSINSAPILIVLAGDAKVDNQKFKAFFHTRPKMLLFKDVEKLIGHVPGAVTPFAVKKNVKIYLDKSLSRFPYVYTAGGSLNSTIKLSIIELEKYVEHNGWIDVTKGWALN
ncbi:MAG: YbaK/EbsC family protein [Leuconostoc falkenbergense]|uniref:YbaK/EbsC family protein n=1 Tax=Leuconostoc falkenbergense TaxID=2766470 RepID=UPI003BB4B6A1